MADIVRTPNQILNVYFSQMIENGVLRGYGMNFYDATAKEGWSPVGYVPSPFGFYPLPGKPADVLQHVEVPELASHMTEMEMIKGMVESATAATRIEKGDTEAGTKTLGEIQLLAAKAAQRISAINKYLKQRDLDLGNKVAALVNANPDLLEDVSSTRNPPPAGSSAARSNLPRSRRRAATAAALRRRRKRIQTPSNPFRSSDCRRAVPDERPSPEDQEREDARLPGRANPRTEAGGHGLRRPDGRHSRPDDPSGAGRSRCVSCPTPDSCERPRPASAKSYFLTDASRTTRKTGNQELRTN